MRKPPCKKNGIDCAKRCPGCQDSCPDMKKWRAEVDAENEKKLQEKNIDRAVHAGIGRKLRCQSLAPGSQIENHQSGCDKYTRKTRRKGI